jgi:hypothetical protein
MHREQIFHLDATRPNQDFYVKAAVGAGLRESGHPVPQHAFRTSHEPEAAGPAKVRFWPKAPLTTGST